MIDASRHQCRVRALQLMPEQPGFFIAQPILVAPKWTGKPLALRPASESYQIVATLVCADNRPERVPG